MVSWPVVLLCLFSLQAIHHLGCVFCYTWQPYSKWWKLQKLQTYQGVFLKNKDLDKISKKKCSSKGRGSQQRDGRNEKMQLTKYKFRLWCPGQCPVCQVSRASWEGRKEMSLLFCRSDTPTLLLWEKSLEGGQDLAEILCLILLCWGVPGRSELGRWMDSLDGWGWTENNNSVALWIRCSLFGTTSKAVMWKTLSVR